MSDVLRGSFAGIELRLNGIEETVELVVRRGLRVSIGGTDVEVEVRLIAGDLYLWVRKGGATIDRLHLAEAAFPFSADEVRRGLAIDLSHTVGQRPLGMACGIEGSYDPALDVMERCVIRARPRGEF